MKKILLATTALLLAANAAYADGSLREGKAKIKREEAKSIALKSVPGTVIDADVEKRRVDGSKKKVLIWIVDVKPKDTTGVKKEVRIDATSGAVLSVKEDTEDDDRD